ncbi:MAG: presqualene diphosphate synthase [Acetobacteraceae bacterium]|jgi:presqualene diphosphate synthase|nr:Squalene synthase HpnD [Rhodopila sp.]MEA2772778.1 presqualene diphosphate synthase [Acetobacteraceae bacterium]
MMAHADKAASGAIGRSTPLGVARQDLDAVETIVRAAGTSFYHGMRMLPADRRHAMYAIYAFCRIVDDIADEDGSLEEKRLGLAVWRDNIARLYQGRTEGPVTRVLAAAVPRFQLRADDFIAVIDGMQTDAETVVVAPDMATLDLYCDRVASAVGRLSVRTFGDASPAADQVAHALGRALQLTNILRDIEEDAQRGRIYLPLEYLRDAGVLADPVAILTAPGLPAVCDRLATLAHGYFRQARDAMDQCDPAAMKPARLMAATYDSILSVLERRGWKRLNERVSLPRWKKLWLACRYGLF